MLHWIYHLYASAAYMVVKLRLLPPIKIGARLHGGNAPPMVPIAVDLARGGGICDNQRR